jgi:site-specific DNA recombinase
MCFYIFAKKNMIAIYTRISKDRKKQVSIEAQSKKGVEYANSIGKQYKIYIDKGQSGTTIKRPSLIKLISDIENKIINEIWVYDQSRLERSIEVKIFLFSIFKQHNTIVHIFNAPISIDIQTEGLMNIMSIVNGMFVDLTKEKIVNALQINAENGKVHSVTPYGYSADINNKFIVNEYEAEIIKEIYSLSLSGVGSGTIGEILTKKGVLTAYNKLNGTLTTTNRNSVLKPIKTINKKDIRWSSNTILHIIKNPIYKGIRVFKGIEYNVPKIVEPDYWEVVNSNLQNNRNNSGSRVKHNYKLKGFLTCSICFRNYYGRTRLNLKDNAYICSSKRHKHLNCNNRGINIPFLDGLTDYFLDNKQYEHIINNASYLIKETDNKIVQLNDLKNKLIENESKRSNIVDAIADGIIKRNDAKIKMEIINSTEMELNSQIKFLLNAENKSTYKNIINNIRIEFNKDSNVYCINYFTNYNDKVFFTYIFDKSYNFLKSYVSNNEKIEFGTINLDMILIENDYLKNNKNFYKINLAI